MANTVATAKGKRNVPLPRVVVKAAVKGLAHKNRAILFKVNPYETRNLHRTPYRVSFGFNI